jgi:hypothetical protein
MSQKLPLFPVIKHSPHKRPNFDSKSYFDKSKVLLYSFSNKKFYSTLFQKFHKWYLIHLLWPYFLPLWH